MDYVYMGYVIVVAVIMIIVVLATKRLNKSKTGSSNLQNGSSWQPSKVNLDLMNMYIEQLRVLEQVVKNGNGFGSCIIDTSTNDGHATCRIKDDEGLSITINQFKGTGLEGEETMVSIIGIGLSEEDLGWLGTWDFSVDSNDDDYIIADTRMGLVYQPSNIKKMIRFFAETIHEKIPEYDITVYPNKIYISILSRQQTGKLTFSR